MTQLITKAVADLPALADESETAEAESTPD
jgi:hypothetical protein